MCLAAIPGLYVFGQEGAEGSPMKFFASMGEYAGKTAGVATWKGRSTG